MASRPRLESAIFTSSPDLTAEYPARAPGRLAGPTCAARHAEAPSQRSATLHRVLLHFYTAKPQQALKHIYLREAAKLRPDR